MKKFEIVNSKESATLPRVYLEFVHKGPQGPSLAFTSPTSLEHKPSGSKWWIGFISQWGAFQRYDGLHPTTMQEFPLEGSKVVIE